MAEEKETNKDLKQNYTVKDKWDKLEIMLHPIGGFFTGLAIAALGYFGSAALEDRQTNEINMRLYSELMNQREQAENKLRSDMFKQIFDSFLSKSESETDKDKDVIEQETRLAATNNAEEAINISRTLLKLANKDLLRLELLTRNFHESIDIKPIFYEILFKILAVKRPIRAIDCAITELQNKKISYGKTKNSAITEQHDKALQTLQACEDLKTTSGRHSETVDRFKKSAENLINKDKSAVKTAKSLLADTDRKINKLRSIAHRISDKQIENLANQTNYKKIRLSYDQVCDDVRPSEPIVECDITNPYTEVVMLRMKANDREYQRIFNIRVTNSYRKWNQVYVEVQATNPNEDVTCKEREDNDIHNMCAKFWVSSFDFPLVDNTYLSEEERYGIAIDSIDDDKREINLVLVYFPASYAGLKEKSFYHKKVLNHLDNWIVIKGEGN